MQIRFPFWLFAIATLLAVFPAQALTIVPPERPAGHHDWRVDSKDGTKSYGIAGDRTETYVWFGASHVRVPAPFFVTLIGFGLLPVGVIALTSRLVRRRHEKAA